MQMNEYQSLAMRTNDNKASERLANKLTDFTGACWRDKNKTSVGNIINACLGLSGETGEFNDLIKKWIFHEKPLDEEHAKKEAGDILWYLALLCEGFGWSLDEISEMNVDKLKNRYPQGFDTKLANNRATSDV